MGIAGRVCLTTVSGVGDGRTFDQAIRALDKLISERAQAPGNVPDPNSPIRRAYERIVRGAAAQVDAA